MSSEHSLRSGVSLLPRSVDSRSAWKVALSRSDLLLLGILLLIYLSSAKGYIQSSDTVVSVRTAETLLATGSMIIDPEPHHTFTTPDGRSYAKYGIGLPLFFLPLVAISHVLAAILRLPSNELTGFLISFANIPFAILSAALFGLLLRRFGASGKSARWLVLGLGAGTLCWRYAGYDFSEALQMGFLLLAIYGVLRGSARHLAMGGAAFAALVLMKIVYAAYLPIFLAYLLIQSGDRRRRFGHAALFASPLLPAFGILAWANFARFGSILETGYGEEVFQFFPSRLGYTIPALMVSLDKGLFVFCPVLILGLLGWRAFARKQPREASFFGVILVLNLLLAASWHSWDGGWSWGPRLLVPMLPIWLFPSAFWLGPHPSRARFSIAVAMVLLSIAVQVPGNVVKDQEIHHIRYVLLTPEEEASFPRDFTAVYLLLWHKLTVGGEVYSASEFGLPDDRTLDLGGYRSFQGLNLWTEFVARRFQAPALRWLPLLSVIGTVFLVHGIRRSERRSSREGVVTPAPSRTVQV